MATDSFVDIIDYNWLPTTAYQEVLAMIQAEVEQGLWANQAHLDGWCNIATSAPHGVNNSWVTYTYQLISDITKTITLIWPVGWPPPAENINGELPGHFFAGTATGTATITPEETVSSGSGTITAQPLHKTYAAPAGQPTYKPANMCG